VPLVNVSRFTVERKTRGIAHMSRGLNDRWDEPAVYAVIRERSTGRVEAGVSLNSTTMCLPEGHPRGVDATDDQIIRAVMGDEHILTGTPTFGDVGDRDKPGEVDLPFTVVDEEGVPPGSQVPVIGRFATLVEAEAYCDTLTDAETGRYGIDGPEVEVTD